MRPPPQNAFAFAIAFAVMVALPGCGSEERGINSDTGGVANELTEQEREEGWTLLFNGEDFSGWTGLGRDAIPEGHWTVEEGTIRKVASGDVPTAADGQPLEGGDIITTDTYRNFEFKLEWKASKGGNSGIKYNVSESLSTAEGPQHAALGFEYQLLDDKRHPDSEEPSHRAAALYDLIPANEEKALMPVGQWNETKIILRGNHAEHWLNGEKVVEYDLDTPKFDSLFAESKYSGIEGFRTRRAGRIVLQDHSDDFWFRNIKVRRLPSSSTE